MDEPIVEGVDELEDEGVSSSERKLLWAAIVVLTIVVLVQAALILHGRLNAGDEFLASHRTTYESTEASPQPTEANPQLTGGMVAGQDNVRWVAEAFAADHEIEAAVGEELVEMLVLSERRIEAVPSRVQSGEIDASEVEVLGREELALRESEMLRLLGPELAAELADRLSGGSL